MMSELTKGPQDHDTAVLDSPVSVDNTNAANTTHGALSGNVVHTFCDDCLGDDDATEIARKISTREISSQEALDAALQRMERVNPKLNAVACSLEDRAKESLNPAPTGLFAGVPSVIKDNEDIRGYPTRHGSRAVSSAPRKATSDWVKQFESMGFVSIAKTTLPEFGLTATTESSLVGQTHNPWDVERSPGGSSGGSAALVAAGVVPLGHGNDGGGSIRIPAACCGLVGLKPTRGRLLNAAGTGSLPINIVHEGVLTRSVRDTAHFYEGAERYYKNAKLPAIGSPATEPLKPLKIAFITSAPNNIPLDSELLAAVKQAASLCESQGHYVEEVPLMYEPRLVESFITYWSMLASTMCYGGPLLYGLDYQRHNAEPFTAFLSRYFLKRAWQAPFVVRRLKAFQQVYEQFFVDHDVIITPVTSHLAPPLGYIAPDLDGEATLDRLAKFVPFTGAQNISGAPAISLPMGLSEQGLPTAVQCCAPYGHDKLLLQLAFQLEAANPFPQITG